MYLYNMQEKYFIIFAVTMSMPIMPMRISVKLPNTRHFNGFVSLSIVFPSTVDFWVRKNPLLAIMGTYACLDRDDCRKETRESHSRSKD